MKKLLLLLISFCSFSSLFCQNAPVDFQNPGIGLSWTWTVFENDTNPPLEMVANPSPGGWNTSSTVAKFTALQTGNPWAGCESLHGTDVGSFSLDSTNCIIKIMVLKDRISDVGIKFVDATSAAQPEIKVANTLINEWEELTFDFSSRIGVYPVVKDQIVIFPDFDLSGRTDNVIVYFDNISFSSSTTSNPTTAPESAQVLDSWLQIYPVPTTNSFKIKTKTCSDYNGEPLRLFSSGGKLVYEETLSSCEVKLPDLSGGTYFVRVGGHSRSVVVGKLVVAN
jgi:hypothetical protein